MAERDSALDGHLQPGRYGEAADGPGVVFAEIRDIGPWQVAAWPQTLAAVAVRLAALTGAETVPGPLQAVAGPNGTVARIRPLVFWLTHAGEAAVTQAMDIDAETGSALDLSHSRTVIRIEGPRARDLLNRGLPLDLSPDAFPAGAFAATALHQVGVHLHNRGSGYDLFVPRGFALSIWELLRETAAQFGYEVRA